MTILGIECPTHTHLHMQTHTYPPLVSDTPCECSLLPSWGREKRVHRRQQRCVLGTINNTHSLSREERVPMLSVHRSNVLLLMFTLMDSMHTLSGADDMRSKHAHVLFSPSLCPLPRTHRYCGPRQRPPHSPWVDHEKRFLQSWGPGGSGSYR